MSVKPQLFLDSLNEALEACELLFQTVERVRAEARRLSGRVGAAPSRRRQSRRGRRSYRPVDGLA